MKLRKINILTTITLATVFILAGCSKDDGAVRKKVGIEEVPVITTNVDATGSQAIDLLNLSAFQGKFKMDLYFRGATPPDKVDIVVRKNGSAANVKMFKADVATFPSSFTVNAADLAALFGTPIALGDTYDFAPNLYVGDKKYEAFPAIGSGNGAGVIGMPQFSEFARFAAICAYDPTIYQGNFVVVSDGFGDFSPGEIVVLTKVSNSSFSFIDPYAVAATPVPIIVNVNTGNNALSITKTVIGSKFVWSNTYTNPAVATTGTSSVVSPCSKTLTLNIAYSVDQGSFGAYPLVLRKQ
jgi:hypothetical protein